MLKHWPNAMPGDRRYTAYANCMRDPTLLMYQNAIGMTLLPARSEAIVTLMKELSGEQRARLARLCRRLVRALAPDEEQRGDSDEEPGAHGDGHGSATPNAGDGATDASVAAATLD